MDLKNKISMFIFETLTNYINNKILIYFYILK